MRVIAAEEHQGSLESRQQARSVRANAEQLQRPALLKHENPPPSLRALSLQNTFQYIQKDKMMTSVMLTCTGP